jgi:phosphoenolpyruvate carboxykinase (ATP)
MQSKIAVGAEECVTKPKATFSTCFSAPFMVHYLSVYAVLVCEKIMKYCVKCRLVNTV